MAKLNLKQERFVAEYVVDPNATQAALRAGYSPKTAYSQGQRLLKHVEVEAAIEEARKELAERAGVRRERIVEEYKRLAFSDLRDSVEWSGEDMALRDSADLSPDAARAIREVVETVTDTEFGKSVRRSVKLHDKLGALRDLAKLLGMFPKEAQGTPGNLTQYNFNFAGVPDDELRRIDRLIEQAVVPPPGNQG